MQRIHKKKMVKYSYNIEIRKSMDIIIKQNDNLAN